MRPDRRLTCFPECDAREAIHGAKEDVMIEAGKTKGADIPVFFQAADKDLIAEATSSRYSWNYLEPFERQEYLG